MTPRDNTNPITDHALLRYMEREQGIDVEDLRNRLATDFVRAACQARATKVILGKTEFRISRDGLVRTILKKRPVRAKGHVDDGKHCRRKKRVKTRLTSQDRDNKKNKSRHI